MSITGGGGPLVQEPPCVAPPFGLLGVADIVPGPAHWETGLFVDLEPCTDVQIIHACPALPETKDPGSGVRTVAVEPFTMVAAYTCSVAGRPVAEAWDRADSRLERGEGRGLEGEFWASLNALAGVVDLTPTGGPTSITGGISLLEAAAGDNMNCRPIIHANRGLATYAAERTLLTSSTPGRLDLVGTGTGFVPGGGYDATGPGGGAVDDGTAWIYVTGGINIVKGKSFFTPERGNSAAAVDRLTNDITVFAERTYAIVLDDCFVAAVQVVLRSCCC